MRAYELLTRATRHSLFMDVCIMCNIRDGRKPARTIIGVSDYLVRWFGFIHQFRPTQADAAKIGHELWGRTCVSGFTEERVINRFLFRLRDWQRTYLSNVLMLIQHQWSREVSASCRCHDKSLSSLQPCASVWLEMKILVTSYLCSYTSFGGAECVERTNGSIYKV